MKKIIIVGGGPAGMMAAIRAGQLSANPVIIERNRFLGRKLLLTGKGRCNLTNACDFDSFLRRFSKNGDFLRDAFKKLFNRQLMDFFSSSGLKLKIERQMRVFPLDDSSKSIADILKKQLAKYKVKILYGKVVKDIIVDKLKKVKGVVLEDSGVMEAEKVILACGGASYSFTGSDGLGFGIASRCGHTIVPLYPGLVALDVKEGFVYELKGLTLKNIRILFAKDSKKITSEIGELLFTDSGISGPLVLTLSSRVVTWLKDNKSIDVYIDLKPALTKEELNQRLLREFKLNSKRTIRNTLSELLPKSLIAVYLKLLKMNPNKKVGQITKEERGSMSSLLKALPLTVIKSRPLEEAMVTCGGVSLKCINPRTMESRLIKGLYFCGEMIDVDADTGGFNLQAAFSTGYLAGESAALN